MDRKKASPFLGQVPLVLGPSSWGATIPFASEVPLQSAYVAPTPPFYVRGGEGGTLGPFPSIAAASLAARETIPALLTPGGLQIVDAAGRTVATIT